MYLQHEYCYYYFDIFAQNFQDESKTTYCFTPFCTLFLQGKRTNPGTTCPKQSLFTKNRWFT